MRFYKLGLDAVAKLIRDLTSQCSSLFPAAKCTTEAFLKWFRQLEIENLKKLECN